MANEEPTKPKSKKSKAKSHSPLVAAASLASENDHGDDELAPKQVDQEKRNEKPRQFKKSKKRARQEAEEAAEERRLTALLFGTTEISMDRPGPLPGKQKSNSSSTLAFEIDRDGDEDEKDASNLFEIDRDGGDPTLDDENQRAVTTRALVRRDGDEPDYNSDQLDEDEEVEDDDGHPKTKQSAAWVDEDDFDLSVNLLATDRLRKLRKSRDEAEAGALEGPEFEKRLRKRFQETTQTTARTDWASVPAKDVNDSNLEVDQDREVENQLLASTSMRLLDSSRQKLPPHILSIVRCRDANQSDPNQAVVQAVHFHPGSDPDRPLLLTAGLDKTLRFFQVGSEESEKIHGIHFPKLPIYSAAFLGTSGNVLVSGRRSYYYIYNAVAGKLDHIPRIVGREEKSLEKFAVSPDGRIIAFYGNDGYIILVDSASKQWMMDLKMNGSVRSICFTPDGDYILASGSDGDVYRWDVRTWKCVERFANEDGSITCSMAASSRHLAVGAESGVVNLYSGHTARSSWSSSTRTPLKSILNLSTSADLVRFNSDGQILAMSTRRDKHGLKLLHVPTGTVFSNWPTSKTPLNYVWSLDFSPKSRFLAIGNDKGKCLLYRLPHYEMND